MTRKSKPQKFQISGQNFALPPFAIEEGKTGREKFSLGKYKTKRSADISLAVFLKTSREAMNALGGTVEVFKNEEGYTTFLDGSVHSVFWIEEI